MPEGPEVKATTDFLKSFIGKQFHTFSVLSGRYAKKDLPGLEDVILPAKIRDVNCKGKFIYFTLSYKVNETCEKYFYLFSTLGMTGMWTERKTKHSRFCFFFDDELILYFNDIRSFGTLKFVHNKKYLDKKLKSLGPDVLNDAVKWREIKDSCVSKYNKTIAECLMKQSVISGIGNYLKAEILYASKVSPHRLCKDITDKEWEELGKNALKISRLSYSVGGATIATYKQPNGKEGLYSRRFAVYNESFDPLGNKVIKETTADKRTTHWVPAIQK